MTVHVRARRLAALTLLALAGTSMPIAASSPSPTSGDVPASSPSAPLAVDPGVSATLPAGFTWEPMALPKRKVDDLPWIVVGAIPGERTLLRAFLSDIGADLAVRESRLWTSTDAATWEAGDDGGVWLGGNQWIMAGHRPNVTAWLASGDGIAVMAFDGELRTSTDGRRWTPVKWPKKVKNRFWDVAGVVRTADGFLAVGQMLDADISKDPEIEASQFTSQDGKRWAVEPIAPGPSGAIRGLAAAPDGTVVATGYRGKGETSEPVLWVRAGDGAWSAVPAFWDRQTTIPVQLGHAAGRFFLQLFSRQAVDGADRFQNTLWTSTDGVTWDEGLTTGPMEPMRLAMAAGAIEEGVLVVMNAPEPGPKIARWSPDWATWTESTIPGIDEHGLDAPIGRLHDGRPVLLTLDPERRSKANGMQVMIPFVGTPVVP